MSIKRTFLLLAQMNKYILAGFSVIALLAACLAGITLSEVESARKHFSTVLLSGDGFAEFQLELCSDRKLRVLVRHNFSNTLSSLELMGPRSSNTPVLAVLCSDSSQTCLSLEHQRCALNLCGEIGIEKSGGKNFTNLAQRPESYFYRVNGLHETATLGSSFVL